MNETIENILNRSSIRSYTSEKLTENEIETLLRAGMSSATAMNRQPWKFVVIEDRAMLDAIAEQHKYGKMLFKAPLAILVCGDKEKFLMGRSEQFWIQDCSAATQNMLVAAKALNLGSCWMGIHPKDELQTMVKEVLKIEDDNLIPFSLISFGHPNVPETIKDKFKRENIIRK